MSATLSPTGQAIVELLDHIDQLEQLHIAGETPVAGQLWDLFRRRDAVRRLVDLPDRAPRGAWPTTSRATEQAARRLVELVMASLTEPGAGR